MSARARALCEAAAGGHRLSGEEIEHLFLRAGLHDLGRAADAIRFRLHPEPVVTYVVDRNINYTNICTSRCRFCAFWRAEGSPEAYVLPYETVLAKVAELAEAGGTQVLMQGGLHPSLPLSWVEGLLRAMRAAFPAIDIHSLSPPEVCDFARREGIPTRAVLARLIAAGLSSLPGGGAEILADRVRQAVSPGKCTASEWLQVMREAHELGLRTTATMVFGHLETPAERAEHLMRVRDLQDETGGFTAFIAWSFQPGNTDLAGVRAAGGHDYLRTLAIARLALGNVPNLQASWVTQGAKVAQVSLRFGANDLGGTMMEENVVAAAGCRFALDVDELRRLAAEAGFTLRQRRTDYTAID